MRVAIIIPDRGDRPQFMDNCVNMIANQEPGELISMIERFIIDFPAFDDQCDITLRYRGAYEQISEMSPRFDIIALMENDDWYSPEYLKEMVKAWEKHGRPDLFGTNYTVYYHLRLRKYFTMRHAQRSNTMNTLIKPGLKFQWPLDHDPFIDAWLWMKPEIADPPLSRALWEPSQLLSVGMKHGVGKCGAQHHVDELDRFINEDNGFLENTLDAESFEFYSNVFPR